MIIVLLLINAKNQFIKILGIYLTSVEKKTSTDKYKHIDLISQI